MRFTGGGGGDIHIRGGVSKEQAIWWDVLHLHWFWMVFSHQWP